MQQCPTSALTLRPIAFGGTFLSIPQAPRGLGCPWALERHSSVHCVTLPGLWVPWLTWAQFVGRIEQLPTYSSPASCAAPKREGQRLCWISRDLCGALLCLWVRSSS